MKSGVIIFCLTFFGFTRADFCYQDIQNSCTVPDVDLQNCNAKFSAVHQVIPELQSYATQHLSQSFQYLLMSINFANYEKQRNGFAKLYRKLSDSTWDDAIELIKYIGKRGSIMNFDVAAPNGGNLGFSKNYNMFELESLSTALDMQKSLAEYSHSIHSAVTTRKIGYHDAETLSYLEQQFVHKHADMVSKLAGHTSDLISLLKVEDPSLSIFMFDEYLQKNV